MILIRIGLIICLSVIFVQDMKYRAVSWIIFPVTAILFYFANINTSKWAAIGFNLSFLTVQIFFLWLYFSLKNRKSVNLLSRYIGLGDILFLYCITFFFSPVNFLFFYISSLVLIILFVIIQKMVLPGVKKEIPLAGLQAMLMCIFLMISNFYPELEFLQEKFIYGV